MPYVHFCPNQYKQCTLYNGRILSLNHYNSQNKMSVIAGSLPEDRVTDLGKSPLCIRPIYVPTPPRVKTPSKNRLWKVEETARLNNSSLQPEPTTGCICLLATRCSSCLADSAWHKHCRYLIGCLCLSQQPVSDLRLWAVFSSFLFSLFHLSFLLLIPVPLIYPNYVHTYPGQLVAYGHFSALPPVVISNLRFR